MAGRTWQCLNMFKRFEVFGHKIKHNLIEGINQSDKDAQQTSQRLMYFDSQNFCQTTCKIFVKQLVKGWNEFQFAEKKTFKGGFRANGRQELEF